MCLYGMIIGINLTLWQLGLEEELYMMQLVGMEQKCQTMWVLMGGLSLGLYLLI